MRFLLSLLLSLLFIVFIFGLALSASVFQEAQAAEDDLIILDEDVQPQADTSPILDFFQRHFGIAGGGFYAGGGGAFEQGFGFGSASFDYPFTFFSRKGRVFVSGGYSYRQVELSLEFEEDFPNIGFDDDTALADRRLELEDPDTSDCSFTPIDNPTDDQVRNTRRTCEFDIKVTDSSAELREAFFEYEIISDVIIAVGRQRPAWGQFDVFSVTNALLPIEFQSREFGFSNSNLRYPQDAVILSYFPTERIELSGYLFLQTSLDPILEKGLRGGSYGIRQDGSCDDLAPTANFIECEDDINGRGFRQVELPFSGDLEGEDKLAYAARAVWRSDYFTAGFTFNQGRFSLLGIFNRLPVVERFCLGDPTTDPNHCSDDMDLVGYNVRDRLVLGEARAFAVEIAVPINQWTIKGEFVYVQSQADIGVRTQQRTRCSDPRSTNISVRQECLRGEREDDLFRWIDAMNGGRGYVDVDGIMAQIGFDVRYDQWNFGLSVLLFQSLLSNEAKRANEFYKAAFPNNTSLLDEGDFDGIPLPTAYVFYDFGVEKQHTIGFAGGFLGVVAGVSVFYTGSKLFDEHFNWTASVDYTTSLANLLIAEANSDSQGGGDSELSEDFSLTFRIGATVEF